LAYICYIKDPSIPVKFGEKYRTLYKWVYNKYFVDEFYGILFVKGLLKTCFGMRAFDEKAIDGAVNGTGKSLYWSSILTGKLQTGYIYHYVWGIVLGLLILLF